MSDYDSMIFSNQQFFPYLILLVILFASSIFLAEKCQQSVVCQILFILSNLYLITLIVYSIYYTVKNRMKKEDKVFRYLSDSFMLVVIIVTFIILSMHVYQK
jgi:hypothetical protein